MEPTFMVSIRRPRHASRSR